MVRTGYGKIAEKIGIFLVGRFGLACFWPFLRINRFQPHQAHKTTRPVSSDMNSVVVGKRVFHAARAVERTVGIYFINGAGDADFFRVAARFVIDA